MEFTNLILAVLAVWLLGITVFGFYIYNIFRNLTKGATKENIVTILNRVLLEQGNTRKEVEGVKKQILGIEEISKIYLQKVGFIRFNPFEELGGDHSFSVALLDGRDSGLVITGLHTRERTRVYVKNIKRGKPELELSVEEKQALKLALRN